MRRYGWFVRYGVFDDGAQQQCRAFGGFDVFGIAEFFGNQAGEDFLTGADYLTFAQSERRAIDRVQRPGLDHNFPEDVVFLGNFYRTARAAENIFDDFGSGFDVLAVFYQQQGDVFVDFVAFFGNPQQGAALDDFVAEFGFAALVDFDSGVFDDASGGGAVAVVEQFCDDFAVDDFASWCCFQRKPLFGSGFDDVVVAAARAFCPDDGLV